VAFLSVEPVFQAGNITGLAIGAGAVGLVGAGPAETRCACYGPPRRGAPAQSSTGVSTNTGICRVVRVWYAA
jgi:hypothetical protein